MLNKSNFKIQSDLTIKYDNRTSNSTLNVNQLLHLNSIEMYEDEESCKKFKIVFNQLLSLGFNPRIINNCYRLYKCQNSREFIDKLVKIDDKYCHAYIEKSDGHCELCEENIDKHIENSVKTYSIIEIDLKKEQTLNYLKKVNSQDGEILELNKKISKRSKTGVLSSQQSFDTERNNEKNNKEVNDFGNNFQNNIDINENDDYAECEICSSEIFVPSIPPIYNLQCRHVFCVSCLDFYFENIINTGNVKVIRCPSHNCNHVFQKSEITDFLFLSPTNDEETKKKKELIEKYLKFYKNIEVEDDRKKFFCPWPNCEGVGMLERELEYEEVINPIVKCNLDPSHEFCVLCGSKKHLGPCLSENDTEILRLVKCGELQLKRCPGCFNWTEKNLGCNHMTCVHCKFQWCWICNQVYQYDHYSNPSNAKCYNKQFAEEKFEFNEDEYYKAIEIAKNIGVYNNSNVNNYFQNNVNYDQNNYDNTSVSKYLLSLTILKSYNSNNNDDCECGNHFGFIILEFLFNILLIIVNFYGSLSFVNIWANTKNYIDLVERNDRLHWFFWFMWNLSNFLFWILSLLNFVMFSGVYFGLSFINSFIIVCIS